MPRPSGLPIIDDETAAVIVAVAHVEMRGRLNVLPRWRKKVAWLASVGDSDVEALMIFAEPGLISLRDWQIEGPHIQERFAEISISADADAHHALRLIQTRYQRLIIPARDRPSLGDSALAHLGLRVERGRKSVVYVCVFSDHIEIMSPTYRDSKLMEGHPLIEDLP
jgi:hypothetical protein